MYRITKVHPEILAKIWPIVRPILDRAVSLTPNLIDVDHVLAGAQTHEHLVWAVTRDRKMVASLTTRLSPYPKGNVLAIDFVAGDEMARWLPQALDLIDEHAAALDCIGIEGYGRPAWGRLLQSRGWKAAYTTYQKEMPHV